MKKLIFSLLIFNLLSACSSQPSDAWRPRSSGVISRVDKSYNKVYIQVTFKYFDFNAGDGNDGISIWFQGSDTCRVGQVVTLK